MDEVLGREHPESQPGLVSAGTLALDGLTRRFASHAAVDALSLELAPGELMALIGASGSGKTTTLRMVAGYEIPDSGRVLLDGRDITAFPPERRDFGMVFQHYALFPHMNVGDNVAFGLQARGGRKADRLAKASAALQNVGLAGAERRAVQSLSGGEQQRVALARALVFEPRVLLLDEPLSNLDPTLRRSTREELRATLHRLGVTALFVTHDQEDAFAVADRVALLERGRLLQVGTPEELYDHPSTRQVAEFIGRAALVPARLNGRSATLRIGKREAQFFAEVPKGVTTNGDVLAVLRPDALEFCSGDTLQAWPGTIVERRFAGALMAYRVKLSEDVVVELHTVDRTPSQGERVMVRVMREPVAVVAP